MRGKIVSNRRCAWGGLGITTAFVLMSVIGCTSPLAGDDHEATLEEAITAAVEHEIQRIEQDGVGHELTQPPGDAEIALADRRDELDALSPATPTHRTPFDLGDDLTGHPQQSVSIDLDSVIRTAVANNLAVQIAHLGPAINREDVINAEAAFDFVLFGGADFSKVDEPQMVPSLGGINLGTPFNANETYRYETGVRKRTRIGGELEISTDLTRFQNNSNGTSLSPDPAYTAALRLGYVQPLLRGFGDDVNTAQIRLAMNSESAAYAELNSALLAVVENAERAYWNLLVAWRNLEVRQWLVDEGIGVRDVLEKRIEFDARLAEYADAVANVEQRKAEVIRAQRVLRAASDEIKRILNDPELTVGSEALIKPADVFVSEPINYNLRAIIDTALAQRPEIRQARLGIDDAAIFELVADNARLPLLDVNAQVAYFGMDADSLDSYENMSDADFIDYLVGVRFEYPFGNRAAESEYQRARLQRSQALLRYREAVQNVVLDVKSALRDVVTNYKLIQATRSFRIAQAENLRALLVEEETLAGLTPEFLNLKFQRQEGLANARLQEIDAMASFDQSLASLYRAMGTGLSMHNIALETTDAVTPTQ